MFPERTLEGKFVIYERATGQRLERWPVDADGMLGHGGYTATPPDDSETASEADVAPVTPMDPSPIPTPKDYAPGVPLVITHAHDAPPAAPLQPPVRSRRGRR